MTALTKICKLKVVFSIVIQQFLREVTLRKQMEHLHWTFITYALHCKLFFFRITFYSHHLRFPSLVLVPKKNQGIETLTITVLWFSWPKSVGIYFGSNPAFWKRYGGLSKIPRVIRQIQKLLDSYRNRRFSFLQNCRSFISVSISTSIVIREDVSARLVAVNWLTIDFQKRRKLPVKMNN